MFQSNTIKANESSRAEVLCLLDEIAFDITSVGKKDVQEQLLTTIESVLSLKGSLQADVITGFIDASNKLHNFSGRLSKKFWDGTGIASDVDSDPEWEDINFDKVSSTDSDEESLYGDMWTTLPQTQILNAIKNTRDETKKQSDLLQFEIQKSIKAHMSYVAHCKGCSAASLRLHTFKSVDDALSAIMQHLIKKDALKKHVFYRKKKKHVPFITNIKRLSVAASQRFSALKFKGVNEFISIDKLVGDFAIPDLIQEIGTLPSRVNYHKAFLMISRLKQQLLSEAENSFLRLPAIESHQLLTDKTASVNKLALFLFSQAGEKIVQIIDKHTGLSSVKTVLRDYFSRCSVACNIEEFTADLVGLLNEAIEKGPQIDSTNSSDSESTDSSIASDSADITYSNSENFLNSRINAITRYFGR